MRIPRLLCCLVGTLVVQSSSMSDTTFSSPVALRSALAGGMAGGVTNAILHPLDTSKVLRQRNPERFASTWDAFRTTLSTSGPAGLYRGLRTAVLGAIPSSALYFGVYDVVKRSFRTSIQRFDASRPDHDPVEPRLRAPVHMLAAVCGNTASALLFVPKEYVKQQLQTAATPSKPMAVVMSTIKSKGIGGLYAGFTATLLRNIPSAALRFVMYEELKLLIQTHSSNPDAPWNFALAGGLAGVVASSLTTPMDVLKTKFATGALDRKLGIKACVSSLVRKEGPMVLFHGLQGRVVWAAMFSAIGFATFEELKRLFGVPSVDNVTSHAPVASKSSEPEG